MPRVICDSGREGWKNKLHNVYSNLEEFSEYDTIYGLHERLGFETAEEAWEANPTVQGSTTPDDFRKSD